MATSLRFTRGRPGSRQAPVRGTSHAAGKQAGIPAIYRPARAASRWIAPPPIGAAPPGRGAWTCVTHAHVTHAHAIVLLPGGGPRHGR
jgi:hypothetical protein